MLASLRRSRIHQWFWYVQSRHLVKTDSHGEAGIEWCLEERVPPLVLRHKVTRQEGVEEPRRPKEESLETCVDLTPHAIVQSWLGLRREGRSRDSQHSC